MSHLSVNIWNVRQTALVGQGCVFIENLAKIGEESSGNISKLVENVWRKCATFLNYFCG
jgi:hypothetical protein